MQWGPIKYGRVEGRAKVRVDTAPPYLVTRWRLPALIRLPSPCPPIYYKGPSTLRVLPSCPRRGREGWTVGFPFALVEGERDGGALLPGLRTKRAKVEGKGKVYLLFPAKFFDRFH